MGAMLALNITWDVSQDVGHAAAKQKCCEEAVAGLML